MEGQTAFGASLIIAQRMSKHTTCMYIHTSEPQNGKPFNDNPELTLDHHIGCGIRFGGEKR